MKRIEKIELAIILLGLVIALIGPIFGMSFLLMPIILLLGLGLAGLTAIVSDRL